MHYFGMSFKEVKHEHSFVNLVLLSGSIPKMSTKKKEADKDEAEENYEGGQHLVERLKAYEKKKPK